MTTPEAIAAILIALVLGAVVGYWWGMIRAFLSIRRMLSPDAPGCPTSHADAQGRVRTGGDVARGGKGEMSS